MAEIQDTFLLKWSPFEFPGGLEKMKNTLACLQNLHLCDEYK
jgi:hypothetical protein